jgi:hypothetical protein
MVFLGEADLEKGKNAFRKVSIYSNTLMRKRREGRDAKETAEFVLKGGF